MLRSLRYKYAGNANYRLINNLNGKIDGNPHPVVWASNGIYATASFPRGILVKGGNTIDVFLHGDVAIGNSPSETFQFDIDSASDAYFVGQTYGYGVLPKATFPTSGRPWFKGSTFNSSVQISPPSLIPSGL